MKGLLPLLLALGFLGGCTPLGFINALVSSELRVQRDIAYGTLPRQTLDLYTSASVPARGVVVFVHGGYWDSGDKADYPFLADTLAENGFATAVVNYRLVPEVTFPSYVQDVALAVAWVLEHAADEGLPDAVFLMGHSAGAHIAALVAYDERYLRALGHDPDELRGFIGLAGPYDFLPLAPDDVRAKAALGPEKTLAQTQPIAFVDGSEPPALLLTGLEDTTVDPDNSVRFYERIRERGGEAVLKSYKGVDHLEIVGALSRGARFLAPQILTDVLGFLRRYA